MDTTVNNINIDDTISYDLPLDRKAVDNGKKAYMIFKRICDVFIAVCVVTIVPIHPLTKAD